ACPPPSRSRRRSRRRRRPPPPSPRPPPTSAPPPWTLDGHALVCLVRTPRGPGVLAFARYTASPVGPYDEVLFVPGVRPPFHVEAIRVSSVDSMGWGRRNWGIPKHLALFDWQEQGTCFAVHVRDPGTGEVFALLEGEGRGRDYTVATGWVPAALRRFDQAYEGRHYRFSPSGRARGRAARVTAVHVGGAGFPEITGVHAAAQVTRLRLDLPVPTVG
ncbi:MAG: hypothetical protein ACK4YP_10925, partial [Myxococcota bacterium]